MGRGLREEQEKGGNKEGGRERGWWLDREQWGKRRVRWEVGEGDMGGG